MTMDNKETTHVTGSKLDISVNWQGAAKAYSFDEVIVDSNGKKLDMRFGGNLTAAEEKKTGCLVCLDSCPVGIVSNATYTYGAVEKRGEVKFKGNASVLPADNTLATVTTCVPNLRVSLSEKRLDTMVPPEMIMEIIPINEMGTFRSSCMTGHPEPSSESGSPRLIKAI